jgi:hypothetical protein
MFWEEKFAYIPFPTNSVMCFENVRSCSVDTPDERGSLSTLRDGPR